MNFLKRILSFLMFSWAKIKRRFVPHFGLFSNLAVKRLPSLFQSNVTKLAGIYLIFSDFPFQRLQHGDISFSGPDIKFCNGCTRQIFVSEILKVFSRRHLDEKLITLKITLFSLH